MQRKLRKQIRRYAKQSRYHSIWRSIVRFMACIVVFCTTYALILPAITMERRYLCGMEAHTHTADCYDSQQNITFLCVPEYGVLHEHGDLCYDEQGQLICPYAENAGHSHSETCLDEEGQTVCTQPQVFHDHSEACILSEWDDVLICTMEEHIHDVFCEANPEADVESAEDWEASAEDLERSGNWPEDLITFAESQIGYRESTRNYVADEAGGQAGYTRYGAWFDMPYDSWDAMFVSFCLHYAGIPEEALGYYADTRTWLAELQDQGLIESLPEAEIAPGDLAFFGDETGEPSFAAIITQAQWDLTENGEPLLTLQILAGDVEDQVVSKQITTQEHLLLGTVSLEKAQRLYEAEHPATVSEEPEVTEEKETTEITETTEATQAVEEILPSGLVTKTVETENYIVTVTYSADLDLPEGTELRVLEYSRDSEIFYQRCVEAGYELDWLLNIGFFLEDTELTLEGGFEVVVASKQGDTLGTDITHFAGREMERISGETLGEEGSIAVAFAADSFSDFGGGVAEIPFEKAPTLLAERANVTLNFTSYNVYCKISFPQGDDYTCNVGDTITIILSDAGAHYREPIITVTGGQLISKNYTCGTANHDHTSWCDRSPTHTIVVGVTDTNVTITGSVDGSGWTNNSVIISSDSPVETEPSEETTVPTETTRPTEPPDPDRPPTAVGTGTVSINRLRFYNICENGGSGVSALAGCVFEITGDNGYTATITSGNVPEVNLPPDIPDGTYTITEVSAPEGYMRDTDYRRSFEVRDGKLVSDRTIGTFINHNLNQLKTDKTAEVEDYNNRIYQILFSAEAHMRMYDMDPVDVLFVVDQSNSMLFPAGLKDTGKQVELRFDGVNNVRNMEALGLDKSQVYYTISDPAGTSTVWAIWHDGNNWLYQDASYYAKAWHNNAEGYRDPNEIAIFPKNRSYADQAEKEDGEHNGTNVRANGGGLHYSLQNSGLGNYINGLANKKGTFKLYTATDEHNRLHYLEEALTNMIYTLADVNDQNRVTLTEFTKVVNASDDLGPLELDPENVETLVNKVQHINTSGGTRQDIALEHVYNNHLNDPNEGFSGSTTNTYTILITDGAPVPSTSDDKLGNPGDTASTTENSIYGKIKGYAALVREKSTLMTVGLGMNEVQSGKEVLEAIASEKKYYSALDNAADLVKQMQNLMFEAFKPKDEIDMTGDVVDEISDSFYPIAFTNPGAGATTGRKVLVQDGTRDWILLESGDWITLEGRFTTAGASDAAGQLLRREDGTFYIRWEDVQLTYPEQENPYAGINPVGVAWVDAGTGAGTGRTVIATYGGKDWIQLRSGDWISQQGEYHNGTPRNYWSYGQYNNGAIDWGWSVNGNNRILFDANKVPLPETKSQWDGTFYVKAKEDFMGGNAIRTNKEAYITATAQQDDYVSVTKSFETPTVNVRLLDMNETRSEVTVYLGDMVNGEGNTPLDSVQVFYDGTVITKLISDGGDVLNKVSPENGEGLEAGLFYLRYALGQDLTEAQWTYLTGGGEITIPYIYDSSSSHGPVGCFRFRLEKTGMEGANPDFGEHEATADCQPGGQPLTENCGSPAETYTLRITYEAYGLGENGRPSENVHNGTGPPGTEVGTGATLETGLGTVEKENVHEVHVISGAIQISKRFEELVTDEQDRTFQFILHRTEDGEDTSRDVTKTVTIPAGGSAGTSSIRFEGLRRGAYTVTEGPDEDYMPQSVRILDTTNCSSAVAEDGIGLTFVMGSNPSNENVIGRIEQTDVYTVYRDPPNGVFGEAEFTNKVRVYTGQVPVTKVWDDGPDSHGSDPVYVVLYLDEAPVLEEGMARLLRLDARSGWTGSFQVVLDGKDDLVTNHNYSVREASRISDDAAYQNTWHPAILEPDGSPVYYERALESGQVLGVNNRGYMVRYEPGENGAWTVTNLRTVELPMTGGAGTQWYTFSGLLLLTAALMYGCSQRRKRERGASR